MRWSRDISLRLLPVPAAIALIYVLHRMTILPGPADRLLDYFLYMCVCCTLIPLPTVPIVIFMGREADPLPAALLGAAGTGLANLIDYAVFGTLLEIPALNQFRQSRTYRRLAALFDTHAFPAQVLANAIPIPIDPVRFMAISQGYSRPLFFLATFLGRLPRYFALAWLGYGFNLSNRVILLILAGMVMATIARAAPGIWREVKARKARNTPG